MELGNLQSLIALDLSSNQLEGAIPAELGQLTTLQALLLSSNRLSGTIPSELRNLSGLPKLDLTYNMLRATDPTLVAFLHTKAPGWDASQTVPPAAIKAAVESSGDVKVSWEPILYTGDGGYYQVLHSTSPGGPYMENPALRTSDKTGNQVTVSGLPAGSRHYFVVRTYTPAHYNSPGWQQNDLLSAASEEVSATLTADMGDR